MQQANWPPRAKELVEQLIAELPQEKLVESHARRLNALPVFGSMWADYYLRPTGEIVIVGEDFDHPDVDSIYSEWERVLPVLVSASRRYPQLRELLPVRGPRDIDCPCRMVPIFAESKVICLECKGLGWLPEDHKPEFFSGLK